MSLVLTMSLLCGCRSEAQNAAIPTDGMNLVGDTTNIDASTTGTSIVSDETTKDIQLINTDLGELTKAEDTAIEKLSDALAMRDMEQSQAAISELAESLSEAEEITGEWLTLQEQAVEEIKPEISDSGNAILTQRAEKLRNEINEKQEQTKAAVEALNQALDSEDFQEAESALESIRTLLQSDSTAQTYGNGNLSENSILYGETTISDRLVLSGDTAINEEIQELAEELGTPLEIYNYLKNTLGYEYYYGSRKGANGTYAACSGNDYDQASLLIGMLRYLGYQAEYVRGTILLEEEPALSLTGADTYEHAADILASAGVPVTKVMQNGEMIELQMEHVWVRACLPYTDYRGAGNAGGEAVWIDLDTSIKTYEEVENIYDIAEEMNLPEGLSEAVENGNEETIEAVLKDFEAEVEAMELEEVYARKRIIRKEIVSYLPASLQYEVKKELATFTEIGNTDKDSIRFDVGGESLGAYNASDLAGKSILLTFLPASTADAEILSSYDSIFDVPASYVYVKPALLIDGEVACEAEDVEITLGTAQTCTITLNRAGNVSDKTIQNPVTAGSMYAVTIDNQTITGDELRNSYNQVAVLTETVNEANVYGPEYLGQYLALAGKLYFAQVDLYNIQSGEVYGVSNTRLLSAGITGYEVQRNSRYGIVTSLSPGSMYIDIDADDHAVISLTGDKEIAKAYTMS
ncbi:MAG: hypothetical protein IJ040_04070, partial [Lachnospiraceae bacterium]|nr:hypothetical protein [Lachnospiraceae bacterium]